MRRIPFLLTAILVCLASPAAAQDHVTYEPGLRVRVETRSMPGTRIVGTLRSWTGDSIVIESDADQAVGSVSLPLGDVTRVDFSMGTRSQWGKGALYGLLGGTLIGLGLGAAGCEEGGFIMTREECIGSASMGMAFVGALVGGTVGIFVRTERWEQLSLDRARISIVPAGRGVGVVASVAF